MWHLATNLQHTSTPPILPSSRHTSTHSICALSVSQPVPTRSDVSTAASANRRALLATAVGVATLAQQQHDAQAVQGIIAGRVPGLSTDPDDDGFYTYIRPEAKSGGHGIGWSEVPRYSFKVPAGWDETPVSIADLGGTEIDLRFGNEAEGKLQVVVAPVLRFLDVGFNAKVTVEQLGSPDKIINGFAPELFGTPLNEGEVLQTIVETHDGLPYYEWELSRHRLVSATAVGNRLFLLAVEANGRQWRKAENNLKHIWTSFRVPSL